MQNPRQSPPPDTTNTATTGRRRWEYEVATVIGSAETLRAELNSAGADGWELVTCESRGVQREMWVVVLKRPVGEHRG